MTNESPTTPQWICTHCFIHLVNGDCTDALYGDADPEDPDACGEAGTTPLSAFGDMHVTPGMLLSEHAEECQDSVTPLDECGCETNSFSWSSCDGCGSNLGGERHAVTGWIKTDSAG